MALLDNNGVAYLWSKIKALVATKLSLSGGTMDKTASIKWTAQNSKNPYVGYCSSSTDGTFMVGSTDGTSYTTGLCIGGSSGNLLWKGKKILDASNYSDYANKYTHPSYTAITGKPTANQTPAFGGTATVSQITSDATGHVTGATDRTIKIPSTLSDGPNTAGLIKTLSKVTSNDGYTACPVINGVPYYKPSSGGSTTLSGLGITATATELNYCDGVTSNIQTQLDAKPEPVDYVIEQDTSGSWYYRKWNNGTYECWGRIASTISGVATVLGGNGCYGSVSFPITFTVTPVVNYSAYGNNGYECAGRSNTNTGSFTWSLVSNATYTKGSTVTINAHVIGRWK